MQSYKEKDIFGDEKIVHRDDYGKIVGETRLEKDIFGDEKLVHYDNTGKKIGESREDTDIFGDKKAIHKDAYGRVVGESWIESSALGGKKVVHRDEYGRKVGESWRTNGVLGGDRTQTNYSGSNVRKNNSGSVASGSYNTSRELTTGSGGVIGGLLACLVSVPGFLVFFIVIGMMYVTENSTASVNLIRSVICYGLSPVATLICALYALPRRADSEELRQSKAKMVITTAALFLVLQCYFAFYTDPLAEEGDSLTSFIFFLIGWIPKLVYSIVMGIFTRKSTDFTAEDKYHSVHLFSSVAFGLITALMEITNVISEGTLEGNFFKILLLFIPALILLLLVVIVLSVITDFIYRKIAG